jgi:hypothetical protein
MISILQLINDLALQISLRDQLIIRIENIRNTYEPGVVSIEMQKKMLCIRQNWIT